MLDLQTWSGQQVQFLYVEKNNRNVHDIGSLNDQEGFLVYAGPQKLKF